MHDMLLILLNLALHLAQLINLFSHLSNSILVLLLERNKGRLLLDMSFLKVLPELADFSFSLLVQLNLSRCGSTSLGQSLTKALKLSCKIRSLSLGLGSGLALSFKFLFHFLNSGLLFLDGLLDLGNKGLLILKLAEEARGILLLASNGIFNLLSGSLKISNSLLSDLQVSLNLPALLLNISSSSLFLVQRRLKLIKG